MKALRLKIALLVMGAIIAMTVIAIVAAYSVSGQEHEFVFRHVHGIAEDVTDATTRPASNNYNWTMALYSFLIVAGAGLVGVVVANMVARPLAILEEAVASVNAEGFIPKVPEKGLGEDLAAARLLNQLSERLRRAMESRMRLVAAAGHDLRTPMTRMRLRLEFMEDSEEKRLWERDIEEISHIAESAIRLVREESRTAEYEKIDLGELLRDLCTELKEIGHQVEILRTAKATVRGGHHSLRRALSNLLVNAATYGNRASVSLDRSDRHAVVVITDFGPGIPEEMIGRAFEPFFRANRAREKTANGAGLGLAIVKEIVERHNGTISLKNGKVGLVQTVSLPLAEESGH